MIKAKNEFGESPVWEEKDSSLVGQRDSWWSSLTGHVESITTEKPVGFVVRKAGGYVMVEGTRFALVDRVMHSITTAAQLDKEKPNAGFSDGKVDPAGRFFAGTMRVELPPAVVDRKQVSLYTLYPDRSSFRPGGHLQQFGLVTESPHRLLQRRPAANDHDIQIGGPCYWFRSDGHSIILI